MFARTERLMLRPAWQEDAGMIAALVQSERKARSLFGAVGGCDLAQPCALDSCVHEAGFPRLLVFRRTSGDPELIGTVGLERSGADGALFFCWIARPHRRQGFGSEAARALMDMAREGLRLRHLVAHEPSGSASERLLERLGFRDGRIALSQAQAGEAASHREPEAQAA